MRPRLGNFRERLNNFLMSLNLEFHQSSWPRGDGIVRSALHFVPFFLGCKRIFR